MANKQSPLNQCIPLHDIYGVDNCCLCQAKSENEPLKNDLKFLVELIEAGFKYGLRDGLNEAYDKYVKSRVNLIKQHYEI
jgi:hypothetical protein